MNTYKVLRFTFLDPKGGYFLNQRPQKILLALVLLLLTINLASFFPAKQRLVPGQAVTIPVVELHLHGLVLNEFGYAVPGVAVTFSQGSNTFTATTNGTGYYSVVYFVDLPADFTVSASRQGYKTFTASFSVPSVSGSTYDYQVDIQLNKSTTASFLLEGVILDHDTNQPISGATVTVWPQEVDPRNPTPIGQMTTDANGYFYITSSQRSPWYQYYGLSVSHPSYASFSTILPPQSNTGVPDYNYEEIKLSSNGYATFHGRVRGDDGKGNYVPLSGAKITIRKQSEPFSAVYEGTSDEYGYYYIPLIALPSDSYIIDVMKEGFETQSIVIPATAGSHFNNFNLNIDRQSKDTWFDTLLSTIKQKAWDALDQFMRSNALIGKGITFAKKFEVGIKGFHAVVTIDLNITYTAPYEVTISVLPGPFNNRIGTSIRLSLPPPLSVLDTIYRFGMTLRLIDPDKNLQTFNPIMVIDEADFGTAIGFLFTWSLDDWLKGQKAQGDGDSAKFIEKLITKLKEFAKDAVDPGKGWDFKAKLKVYVNGEIGIRVEFNGVEGSIQPGMSLDNIAIYPYLNVGASLEASAEIAYRVYLNKWLKFNVVSGKLSISASTETNIYPFQATYYILKNSLQLDFGRIYFAAPHMKATFSWSLATFSGTITLVDWDKGTYDSGWLYSFTFGRSQYENINYPPSAPTISGPTSVDIYQSATYSFQSSDPESDSISYEIKWGDGTSTTSDTVSSGTTYQVTRAWSSLGTYTIQARAVDSKGNAGNWKSYSVKVNPISPNVPIISGSGYITVGKYYSISFSVIDPQGSKVQFTIYWGDGTKSTSGWINSGTISSLGHYYSRTGSKLITVVVKNTYDLTNSATKSISVVNNAPYTPSAPSGPSSGVVNTGYTYKVRTSDPDGHKIRYKIDWGDGSYTYTSYYRSGTYVYVSHSWSTGTSNGIRYYVKVRAQDQHGAWSGWSVSLSVIIRTSSGGGGGPIILSDHSMSFPILSHFLSSDLDLKEVGDRFSSLPIIFLLLGLISNIFFLFTKVRRKRY